MAASNAIDAFGTVFQIGDGATPTEAFTTIAEVQTISGPAIERLFRENTHMESPNNWREFAKGLKDGGEITLEMSMVPGNANLQLLTDDLADNTARGAKLIFPDSGTTTWTFAAGVSGFTPNANMEDTLRCSVTLKITKEITLPS